MARWSVSRSTSPGRNTAILLDAGDRLVAIGAVDASARSCSFSASTASLQVGHFLLLLPALADPLEPLGDDTVDVQQLVGPVLKDVECPLLVQGHDLRGELGADAADGARGQVPLDPLGRGGVRRLQLLGAKLLAVLAIDGPAGRGFDVLAAGDDMLLPTMKTRSVDLFS